jgi:DNA processing protein
MSALAVRAADPEWRALVAWSRLAEPGDEVAARLVQEHGALAALERVLGAASGTERFAARADHLDIDADLEAADWRGARVVVAGDPDWPRGLDDLDAPPYCLWVLGPGLPQVTRSVAVVGARVATAYGIRIAEELGAGLAARGYAVVSGGAYGIDGAAHRGALAVEGTTIAVLAGGINRVYPSGHRELIEHIATVGAVVSEVPPSTAPLRTRFLTRNRLIATMTTGTVVVEAAARSGSLNTARWARDHHRVVGVIPGPVTSVQSTGCHQWIRDGYGTLVTDTAEVIELVGTMGDDAAPRRRGPVDLLDDLGERVRHVYAAMPARAATSVARLAVVSGRTEREVRGALGRLSLVHLVERTEGGWRRCGHRSSAS